MAAQLMFTEKQANAILEMRLYKLIGLELEALINEHEETMANIYRYEDILDRRDSMAQVIMNELDGFKKEYSHPRKLSSRTDRKRSTRKKNWKRWMWYFSWIDSAMPRLWMSPPTSGIKKPQMQKINTSSPVKYRKDLPVHQHRTDAHYQGAGPALRQVP